MVSSSLALLVTLLPGTLMAMPFPNLFARATTSKPYVLKAANAGSDKLNSEPISASGGKFWVGKPTKASCPAGQNCPAGGTTAVSITGSNANLDVNVPGGQKVYVSANGELSYTAAGQSNSIPAGSASTTFLTTTSSPSNPNLYFEFEGLGARHFLACPQPGSDSIFQIYATVENLSDASVLGGSIAKCDAIQVTATQFTGNVAGAAAAYEYD